MFSGQLSYVIKLLLTQVIWRFIVAHVMVSIHVPAMHVIKVTNVLQQDLSTHITRIHNPVICGCHSLWGIVLEIITLYNWCCLCLGILNIFPLCTDVTACYLGQLCALCLGRPLSRPSVRLKISHHLAFAHHQ